MKCSFCNEIAEFKCNCQQPFMCLFHLGVHQKASKNHPFENLDEELGDLRLKQFRLKLMKRIQKVNIAKSELASKSKSLIKSIKKAIKHASDSLDTVIKSYIELLMRFRFCVSELPMIEQIESFDINVRAIEVDKIASLVENTYSIDWITYEKNILENVKLNLIRSNGHLDLTLKQRIEYFYPIVLDQYSTNLNWWDKHGKELLISNDGKHIFVCKLY